MKTLIQTIVVLAAAPPAYVVLPVAVREYAEVLAAVLIDLALFAPGLLAVVAVWRAGRDVRPTND